MKVLTIILTKKETQGDKTKNQLYKKIVAYNIQWVSKSRSGCETRVHVRSLFISYKNSLVKYGGMRVVRIPDDLGGSSSRGRGGVVARSAVVHCNSPSWSV